MTSLPDVDTAIDREEALALRDLAAGRLVLEVGSAWGFSAILMAEVAQHVFAVDPHEDDATYQNTLETMTTALTEHGYRDAVSIVLAPSQQVLPALHAAGARFGLVFIDGDHDAGVLSDVTWGLRLLASGGALAVHDYGPPASRHYPQVTEIVDRLTIPNRVVETLWIGTP